MNIVMPFLVAFIVGTRDVFYSQPLFKSVNNTDKAFWKVLGVLPLIILWAILEALSGWEMPQTTFWPIVLLHSMLMVGATILYLRALALGPLSQTQPILTLSTVFLLITNPLITDEVIPLQGWVGVLLVGVGVYATTHPGQGGFFAPFREAAQQPGILSKLGVAVIYSITANLDRLALNTCHNQMGLYQVADTTGLLLMLSALYVLRKRCNTSRGELSVATRCKILLGGNLTALEQLTHMAALTFTTVPYVIAIKRTSIVLTSLWGYTVRKERSLNWYRLLGLFAVVAGVTTIVFSP